MSVQPVGMPESRVADTDVNPGEALLEVKNLRTSFFTGDGVVHAVDNVSFNVRKGEAVALVGESGCGKSVTAMSIMRLVGPPGKITGGEVRFKGSNLADLSERDMRHVRGNDIAMVFQEPMTSLNPVFKIGDQVAEAIRIHQKCRRRRRENAPARCWSWSRFRIRSSGSTTIRISFPAACVNA